MTHPEKQAQKNRLEALIEKHEIDTHVFKSGGTDVCAMQENVARMQERRESGMDLQVVAVSAMRSTGEASSVFRHERVDEVISNPEKRGKKDFNTTSHLLLVAKVLKEGNPELAASLLKNIQDYLKWEIGQRLEGESEALISKLEVLVVEKSFEELEKFIFDPKNPVREIKMIGEDCILSKEDGSWTSLLRIGEDISAEVNTEVAKEKGLKAVNITLSQHEVSDIIGDISLEDLQEDFKKRTFVKNAIREALAKKIREVQKKDAVDVVFAGGYIPMLSFSRGYTDTTAAFIASALKKEGKNPALHKVGEVNLRQVSPSIDVNSPSVDHCSYTTLREIVSERGVNNPIVEDGALTELQEADIPTLVYNPKFLNSVSLVTKKGGKKKGILFVDKRKGTTTFTITGKGEIMHLPGTDAAITKAFQESGLSYQHSATAGNSITYTFNDSISSDRIYQLEQDIKHRLRVEDKDIGFDMKSQKATVFCKGDNMDLPAVAAQVFVAVAKAGVNVEFITQPHAVHSLAFCVAEEDADTVVKAIAKEVASRTPVEFLAQITSQSVKEVLEE